MAPQPATWLFDAGEQRPKVLGVMLFSGLCALGSSWAAWGIWHNMGLSAADGNQLRPWPERLAMAALVAGLGWTFLVAMLVYLRCYVSRIFAVDSETIELRLLWPGRAVQVAARDGAQTQAHAGQYHARMTVSVSAPWMALRLPGRRLPLIIDEQGSWNPAVPRPRWLQ